MKKRMILSMMLAAASINAACLPPSLGQIATGSNPRGDWVGWWCRAESGHVYPYVAACLKSTCSLVGSKRSVSAWLNHPTLDTLVFGSNPNTDAALLAVWAPDRSLLDAVKP